MLNPFPSVLAWGMLAPFLIRLVVGLYFVEFGFSKLKEDRIKKASFFESIGLKPGSFFVSLVGLVEFVAGLALIAGIYTQIFALITGLISIVAFLLSRKYTNQFANPSSVFFLLFVMSITLFLTGAGFYAFDAPL